MLKQRIITAVVLLAILLPALFWPSPDPFRRRHAGADRRRRLGVGPPERLGQARLAGGGGRMLALCAASWSAGWLERPSPVLWIVGRRRLGAGRGAGCCAPAWRAGRASRGPCAWSAACWRCGWPGWRWRRRASIGINFLLSVLVLVWVADISAYFAGPRLRPQVHQAQAGARDQPRQELGRRLGRHGRRAGAGASPGSWADRGWQAQRAQPLHAAGRARAGGCW